MPNGTDNNKGLLIYRSSAGSGKTFTLVLNYLSLIIKSDNPNKFREILAITFTNKAANEMKKRVFKHLKELAENNPDSDIVPVYVAELDQSAQSISEIAKNRLSIMLHNYGDVSIITIDRFAHRLIRSFSRDLNLQADFEIEMDFSKVLQEAIDGLMQQVGSRKDLTELIVHYAKDLAITDKSWKATKNLYEIGQLIKKEDTDGWIQDIKPLGIQELFDLHKHASTESNRLKEEIKTLGHTTIDHVEKANIFDWIPRGWSGWLGFFKKSMEGDTGALLSPAKSIISAVEEGKWLKKNAPDEVQGALTSIEEKVIQAFLEITGLCKELKLQQLIREQIIGLGLLKEISVMLDQYKTNNNLVLISDFNKTISGIVLQQPTPFIYERIGCRFNHYFIDEFQDTSVQQWQNFIPLIDDSLAQSSRNLLVGDAKQAIYRFRNGESKQFVLLPEIYQKKDSHILYQAEETFKRQALTKELKFNYRSSTTVVEFNNQLYSFIKEKIPTSVRNNYNEFKQTPHCKFDGYVEIQLQNLNKNDQQEDRKQFEEQATLDAINGCLADGFIKSDITILVRKNKTGQELADFLISNTVSVTSADSIYLLRNKKVKVVIALLKVLENIHTRVDVMMIISYFFPANQTEKASLAQLKSSKDMGKDAALSLLFDSLEIQKESFLNEPLYAKSRKIIALLFDASEQDQFLESFLENAHQYTSAKGEDTSQFIDWLEEKNPSIETAENEDAVQIMTIHKSKGLEFNVVILHHCNWELGPTLQSRVWTNIVDGSSNFNLQIYPSEKTFESLDKGIEYEEAYAQEFLDGLNLFYVATTRPVHRLYINSARKSGNRISELLYDFVCKDHELCFPIKYQFGKASRVEIEREDQVVESFTYNPNPNLRLEITSQHIYESNNSVSERKWGELLHQALEFVQKKEEIHPYAEKLKLQGKLAANQESLFHEQLQSTITHPDMIDWFNGNCLEMKEREIIDENGDAYRPDRIILYPDQTILLDFKTGRPRNKDEQQIKKYNDLLIELGYTNIKNYLFYIENGDLVKVNNQ